MATANPFLLAADNDPKLLPLLRSNPALASSQDAHGYSILHAAASYNHLDLLRQLVSDFHVDPNIKDEDGETPLFVVETVQAAQVLVEELGIDATIKNSEGLTAEQKILAEGDYMPVADFLRKQRVQHQSVSHSTNDLADFSSTSLFNLTDPPPLPRNFNVDVATMDEDSMPEGTDVNPEFKRRIEELAAREDFQEEGGQRQLRELITDVVRDHRAENTERDVRQRLN
jgi:hypothetical protein